MKTVAFHVQCWWVGGSERWVATLCTWLDPARFKVTEVVVPRGMINPLAATWLPPAVALSDSDKFPEADVVVTWGFPDLCRRVPPGRTVVDVQHVPGVNMWVLKTAREAATAHQTLGVHLAAVGEECAESFPAEVAHHVQVIPNGVDPKTVLPHRRRDDVRAGLGLRPTHKLAICVGRVSHAKNTQLFLDAVSHMPAEWHGVTVGPPQQLSDIPEIRYGVRTWSRGPVSHVGDLLAAADVLVHPSEFESHGLTLNEAWLAKVPTVAVAHPTNRRFQRLHGQMSELVDPRPTAVQLADATERAAAWSPAQLEHAYQVACRHYTAQVMGQRWSDYLDKL